jgi:phenylpropionate dioxygenase-like ring-hydroxylating dioxygenase large terminal subunit
MLSPEDNDIVTRVGAGTPGGDLIRQYWMPAAMSSELPGPDCAPLRVRLLGEDLVAFRDTSGQVGLVGAHCPHRGASLFFGRNEDNGLRCAYHGWKFNRDGRCMDMPNSPDSNLKQNLKHKAYPCVERGRVVWTYMGPMDPPPPLPMLPFMDLPDDHVLVYKHYQDMNWLQGVEGNIDPSHGPYLHSQLDEELRARIDSQVLTIADNYFQRDGWSYDAADLGHAAIIASWRATDEERNYWRLNTYFLPCFANAPTATGENPAANFFAYAPIDDEHCFHYGFTWHGMRPLNALEHSHAAFGFETEFGPGDPTEPGSEWRPKLNRHNDYGLSREMQKTLTFAGIPERLGQDQAMTESMGAIYDRTQEHLVPSDKGIITARKVFLRAAKQLRDKGTVPPGVMDPEVYQMRAADKFLPKAESKWVEALRDYYTYRPGYNPTTP